MPLVFGYLRELRRSVWEFSDDNAMPCADRATSMVAGSSHPQEMAKILHPNLTGHRGGWGQGSVTEAGVPVFLTMMISPNLVPDR